MELGDRDCGWLVPPGTSGSPQEQVDLMCGKNRFSRKDTRLQDPWQLYGGSRHPDGSEIMCAIPRTSQPQKGRVLRSKAAVRIVVQDFRARVFAHLPEISLPLLANGSQPRSGHPGVVGAVV